MNKSVLRLILLTQVFTLFLLLFMPILIHWLSYFWGRVLYTGLALAALGLALAIRYALTGLE